MLKTPQAGEPITAAYLETLRRTILGLVRPGRGIKIESAGPRIIISADTALQGKSAQSDNIWVPYEE